MKLHESKEYDLKEILEDVDDLSWDCLGIIQWSRKHSPRRLVIRNQNGYIKIKGKMIFHLTNWIILSKLQRQWSWSDFEDSGYQKRIIF